MTVIQEPLRSPIFTSSLPGGGELRSQAQPDATAEPCVRKTTTIILYSQMAMNLNRQSKSKAKRPQMEGVTDDTEEIDTDGGGWGGGGSAGCHATPEKTAGNRTSRGGESRSRPEGDLATKRQV